MASILFNIALEYVIRKLSVMLSDKRTLILKNTQIVALIYADDINILS